MTSKLVSEWNCLDRWKKEWRSCPDVVMSFLNLATHETLGTPHCAKSALCGPWEHPWPLPCRWLTGSPQTAFPNLTPFSPPPPASLRPGTFWKRQAFYSFTSRRHAWYHPPIELYWRQTDVGYRTRRGRNNRLVYRRAGCVYSRFSLACFLQDSLCLWFKSQPSPDQLC